MANLGRAWVAPPWFIPRCSPRSATSPNPQWRGRAVGIYRVWRDLGYAVGAIMGGVVADQWSLRAAVWVAAEISVISALVVAVRMYETHHRPAASAAEETEENVHG